MLRAAVYLRSHAFRVGEVLRDRRDAGATATEYGLLVTFVAVAIVVAVTAFGTQLGEWFQRLADSIDGWDPGGADPVP